MAIPKLAVGYDTGLSRAPLSLDEFRSIGTTVDENGARPDLASPGLMNEELSTRRMVTP